MRELPKPQGDVSKLPKWAQLYVEMLQRDLKYAYRQAAEGPGDSDIFLDWYTDQKPLGRRKTVRFVLADGHWVDVSSSNGVLTVLADDTLLVASRSSNVVHLYAVPYRALKALAGFDV
jgi:hypothetical protein